MRAFESCVLTYLLNSLWQVPLLFAAGWLAARALRGLGPAAEHSVWVAVLLLQSMLPACSVAPLEYLSSLFSRAAHAPGEAHVAVSVGPGVMWSDLHPPDRALFWLTMAYCAVTVWYGVRFLWHWLALGRLRDDAVDAELDQESAHVWAQCLERFGLERVRLATSTHIFSPVSLGLRCRLVLLPAGKGGRLCGADLKAVLAHELAHIRRGDFLRNLMYEVAALPVSYHPLLRLTRERLLETREMVCDQMAAEISGPREYTRSLLRLASCLARGLPARTPHALGIFDTNTLERRVMNLTDRRPEICGLRRIAIVFTCAALGAGTCASALALRVHVDGMVQAGDHSPAPPKYPVAVKPEIMAGQRISGVMPVYPEAAKKARIQGKVIIDVVIGKDGSVLNPKVDSGPKELRESALDAVRQWKYKPFLLNGQPIEVKTTVHVVYTLASKHKE